MKMLLTIITVLASSIFVAKAQANDVSSDRHFVLIRPNDLDSWLNKFPDNTVPVFESLQAISDARIGVRNWERGIECLVPIGTNIEMLDTGNVRVMDKGESENCKGRISNLSKIHHTKKWIQYSCFEDQTKHLNLFISLPLDPYGNLIESIRKKEFARSNNVMDTRHLNSKIELPREKTALLRAAQKNDLPGVIEAILAGDDPDTQGIRNATALMHAVVFDNVDMVRFLVGAGTDVNIAADNDLTALHFAVDAGALTVGYLIANGADWHVKATKPGTNERYSALHMMRENKPEIFDRLIRQNWQSLAGREKLKTAIGWTVLHSAVYVGDGAMVQNHLRKQFLDTVDVFDHTPLDLAREKGYWEIAGMLAVAGK